MKNNVIFILIICLGLININFGISAEDGSGIMQQEQMQERIAALIKALGADQAKTREEATEELKKIGEPALPALQEAAKSEDPEVAWRAKIIIRAIEKTMSSSAGKSSEDNRQKEGKKQHRSEKFSSNTFRLNIPGKAAASVGIVIEPGQVSVTITEHKNGKEITNTYSAESIKEFRQKYPEIAKEYGIEENHNVIELPDMEIDEIWEDFDKSWGRRWDGFNEQMKRMDEMMKRFQEESKQRLKERENWPGETELPEFPEKIQPAVPKKTDEFGVTVEFIEPALRIQLNLTDDIGVLVKEVTPDSPADQVGLKQWDVALEVNGQPVKTIWEFRRLLKEGLQQNKAEILIIRQGAKQLLKYVK